MHFITTTVAHVGKNCYSKPRGRPLKYITEKERKDAKKNGRKMFRKNKMSIIKV